MGRGPSRLRAAHEGRGRGPRLRPREARDHPQPAREPQRGRRRRHGWKNVKARRPLRHFGRARGPRGQRRRPLLLSASIARHHHRVRPRRETADLSLLTQPWELDVARQLAFWPEVVEDATLLMEPHRVPYYVHDLATAVHRFYHAGNEDGAHRVVVDDPLLTRARLELCRAARHTLKTALDLIGVSAPERM
ncbi:MAG: hypothetical protein E6I77_10905 [Chloroflexi bacterium]|nr:MAG: hypothetical protein E6I77_10905 [Chloroflexota bacterium]